MPGGIGNSAKKSAAQLAQQIARQMGEEPLEVLKTAKEQATGVESSNQGEKQAENPQQAEQQKKIEEQQKKQDEMKSQRLMEALKRELSDIEHQDVFHTLQAKITEGIEVPLEEYPELTREQKEVLMAQMQAVKEQKATAQARAGAEAPPVVSAKPSRRMGSTRKQEAQKQQQHVEKPVPPSG